MQDKKIYELSNPYKDISSNLFTSAGDFKSKHNAERRKKFIAKQKKKKRK